MRSFIVAYAVLLTLSLALPFATGSGDGLSMIFAMALTLPWTFFLGLIFDAFGKPSPIVIWLLLALSGALNVWLATQWSNKKSDLRRKATEHEQTQHVENTRTP